MGDARRRFGTTSTAHRAAVMAIRERILKSGAPVFLAKDGDYGAEAYRHNLGVLTRWALRGAPLPPDLSSWGSHHSAEAVERMRGTLDAYGYDAPAPKPPRLGGAALSTLALASAGMPQGAGLRTHADMARIDPLILQGFPGPRMRRRGRP